MATLNINGRRVTVDDSFLQLSPEQQEATVNEIASSFNSQPSPVEDVFSSAEDPQMLAEMSRMSNPEMTWGQTAVDALQAGGAGVARGIAGLAGLPGTIADLGGGAGEWLMSQAGFPTRTEAMQKLGIQDTGNVLSSGMLQSGLSNLTGGATDFRGDSTLGQYAGTVGEFLPGAAIGGLNPGDLARFGVLPGVASEAAGQVTEGTSIEPYARVAAALAAPAIPALASRAISPFGGAITPERQSAISALEAEGIPLTAGQRTGSQGLRYMESELGGRGAAAIMDDQANAFTNAAMQRAGGQGLATPENMSANADRLSQGFRDVSARNTLKIDGPWLRDLTQTMRDYNRTLPSEQSKVLGNIVEDIGLQLRDGNGTMTGQQYQSIRSNLTKKAFNARNNAPDLAEAYRGVRNSLDNAMARSVSPEDAATWSRLRQEYGNMKVLEKAATGAGEDAALGSISPAKLRQAATAGRQGQYARGTGDFDQLARSGQAVMTPLPNSGTAGRIRAQNLGSGILAGGGALAGGLPGMVAGLLAPRAAGAALMSRPVQAYLSNQVAPNMSAIDPRTLSVIQSLISNRGDN